MPLAAGNYEVTVRVTNLAGASATETKTLVIQAAASGDSHGQSLSNTGTNLLILGGGALAIVAVSGIVLWRVVRRRR